MFPDRGPPLPHYSDPGGRHTITAADPLPDGFRLVPGEVLGDAGGGPVVGDLFNVGGQLWLIDAFRRVLP